MREVSLGDYVLNGGEVAALAIVEAVVRLLPGFMGNAESLAEESHGDSGLLEYPVFTKPPSWRGLDVPEVLLSGDHARIAAWREDQSRRRTAQRRPDLLAPASVGDVAIRPVRAADAGELLTLQRACWVQEQQANPDVPIDALTEDLDDVAPGSARAWCSSPAARAGWSARSAAGCTSRPWDVGRLMVAPDLQGQGLGRTLLEADRARPHRRRRPGSSCSPVPAACATSGPTRRPATRCAGERSPGVVRMTKRR